MEIVGTIKAIQEPQQFNKLTKVACIIETDEKFPQTILVEFLNDSIEKLNRYAAGDYVVIGINIRGREWQSPSGEVKYFTSINGWTIAKVDEVRNAIKQSKLPDDPMDIKGKVGNIEANFQEEAIRDMEDDNDDFPF